MSHRDDGNGEKQNRIDVIDLALLSRLLSFSHFRAAPFFIDALYHALVEFDTFGA